VGLWLRPDEQPLSSVPKNTAIKQWSIVLLGRWHDSRFYGCKLVSKKEFMLLLPDVLTLDFLRREYLAGRLTPIELIEALLLRLDRECPAEVFIHRIDPHALLGRAQQLSDELLRDPGLPDRLPLFGMPYAVKDNIDVAGVATTCACPEFAYIPSRSATVVERLDAAGAMLIGKTNLDQFATGLVGTRSPYGEVRNPFNPDYVSGGSSSGSAAAVALGLGFVVGAVALGLALRKSQ